MKKAKIYYNPIEGSAPLSIYWSNGPKGDAVEANNEDGVGFFSSKGDLLGVIFDDVSEQKDSQKLIFDYYVVEVNVVNGKVSCQIINKKDTHKKTA